MVDGFDTTATRSDAAVYKSLCSKGADGDDDGSKAGGGGGGGSRAWASEVPTPPTLAALLTPSSSVQFFFSSAPVVPVELVVDVESSYVFEDHPAPVVAATEALKAFLLNQTRAVLPTTGFEVTSDRGGQYYDNIEITVSPFDSPLDVEFTGATTGRWRRYERKTTRDVLIYELDGSWDLSGVYASDTHTLFLDLTPAEGGGFGYGRDVHRVLGSGS